jgi:hypothetical protein
MLLLKIIYYAEISLPMMEELILNFFFRFFIKLL